MARKRKRRKVISFIKSLKPKLPLGFPSRETPRSSKPRSNPQRAETYADRDATLKQLGFSSYLAYLNSDLWISIRNRVFRKYGAWCNLCSKPAILTHHISYSYSVLIGQDMTKLVPLCHFCHLKVEFTGIGRRRKKRTLLEAQKQYYVLLNRRK